MQESWYCPSLNFSVQPLCPLCLCGYRNTRYNNHRDTENTEVAQRRVQIRSLPPIGLISLKPDLYYYRSTIRDEPDFLIEPFAPDAALRAVNASDSLRDCNGTATGRGTTADGASVGG